MHRLDFLSIPQVIVLFYCGFILLGSLLLLLPWASQSGQVTPVVDAVFTATSAICVTGQVTLNTAQHWSLFGQWVILGLIELGGLGFMAFLAMSFLVTGQAFSVRHQQLIADSLNFTNLSQTGPMIYFMIKFSLLVQLVGSLLLAGAFVPDLGWAQGIYFAVFHAVSAFCNAGFDLFGDSLIGYQDQPYVLLVIAGLIMTGGLGFLVWRDLLTFRSWRSLLLHTKLVLLASGLLWLGGSLLYWWVERPGPALDGLDPLDKWVNSFFMAVTARTAGYASVDYSQLHPASIMLTLVLMFIGGASGSTAGGIKLTTLLALLVFIWRNFQGRRQVVFGRQIPDATIQKAMYIFFAGSCIVVLASFVLLVTEGIPPAFGLEYVFVEVVSCFATVGLTLGLTPQLSLVGKGVLILLMLMGRVGLLTFFWAFNRHLSQEKIQYPLGRVLVG